jgi:hypothetical protein
LANAVEPPQSASAPRKVKLLRTFVIVPPLMGFRFHPLVLRLFSEAVKFMGACSKNMKFLDTILLLTS